MEERHKSFSKFYVYNLEGLATTFREYKTIKMCEFYGMADILMNPKPKPPLDMNNLSEEQKVFIEKTGDFLQRHKDQFNVS